MLKLEAISTTCKPALVKQQLDLKFHPIALLKEEGSAMLCLCNGYILWRKSQYES